MDSKFRSSFIPKSSIDDSRNESQGFGLVSGLAILIFILSIVSSGGFFAYKIMLRNEINNLKSQIASAEAAIDKEELKEILLFDKRLESMREALNKHVALSDFFGNLESKTVSQIHFQNLRYAAPPNENIAIEMSGQARSFAAIALEESVLLKDPNTVSANFSNMRVEGKDGSISFTLKAEFKKDLIKFVKPIQIEDKEVDDAEEDLNIDDINFPEDI